MIEQPSPKVYDELLSIWEEAVRSTHHFLTEADIQFYKPLIRHEYLAAVRLYIIREDSGTIAAFMGLSNDCIEMLFVRPNAHGHGYGSRLVEFAIRKKRIYKVDVNEQNAAALGFYLHMGFETTGRDALAATGKPFPILHLQIPPIRLRKQLLRIKICLEPYLHKACRIPVRLTITGYKSKHGPDGELYNVGMNCFKATYTFCWQKTAESLKWQDSHLSALKDICIACSYIPTINARE